MEFAHRSPEDFAPKKVENAANAAPQAIEIIVLPPIPLHARISPRGRRWRQWDSKPVAAHQELLQQRPLGRAGRVLALVTPARMRGHEIGRASCRERV